MVVTTKRIDKRGEDAIATIGNRHRVDSSIGHNIANTKAEGLGNLARGERSLEFVES
jgi:hypothetical protein